MSNGSEGSVSGGSASGGASVDTATAGDSVDRDEDDTAVLLWVERWYDACLARIEARLDRVGAG